MVTRVWSAPAGIYPEAFYLIEPTTREVFYEGVIVDRDIWGLQGRTALTDVVADRVPLTPGKYAVVFALGGVLGGEFPVEAFEAPGERVA